jgi:hypothetical protein
VSLIEGLHGEDDRVHYSVFLLYLVVLVALPLFALQRWGLPGARVVTVLLLAFVAASTYVIATNKIFPVPVQEPLSDHPFARIRAQQAAGYVELMIWGFTPAVAALAGGALSVVWSVAGRLWRAIGNRKLERHRE